MANGKLERQVDGSGWTTWRWDAPEPMASYLATATVGQFDLESLPGERHPVPGRGGPGAVRRARWLDIRDAAGRSPISPRSSGSSPGPRAAIRSGRRRHRRRARGARIRPREPDPPDLRTRLLHRPARRRPRLRPRAGAPVVRRRPACPMAGHLAERGLRQLRRVAVGEAKGGAPRRRSSTTTTQLPGGRPGLAGRRRRPGPRKLFDGAVYDRGAMTLHQLRLAVGDRAFFKHPPTG